MTTPPRWGWGGELCFGKRVCTVHLSAAVLLFFSLLRPFLHASCCGARHRLLPPLRRPFPPRSTRTAGPLPAALPGHARGGTRRGGRVPRHAAPPPCARLRYGALAARRPPPSAAVGPPRAPPLARAPRAPPSKEDSNAASAPRGAARPVVVAYLWLLEAPAAPPPLPPDTHPRYPSAGRSARGTHTPKNTEKINREDTGPRRWDRKSTAHCQSSLTATDLLPPPPPPPPRPPLPEKKPHTPSSPRQPPRRRCVSTLPPPQ